MLVLQGNLVVCNAVTLYSIHTCKVNIFTAELVLQRYSVTERYKLPFSTHPTPSRRKDANQKGWTAPAASPGTLDSKTSVGSLSRQMPSSQERSDSLDLRKSVRRSTSCCVAASGTSPSTPKGRLV